MRPLEDAGNNRWIVADFSVMMVAVDLGPQQFQDNARSHTARAAMHCLTACQTIPWPARFLSNQASLGYNGKGTASTREC
ncbi:hypothetical protein TNCV_537171 [Trichonephila clavipes]|nr:hypothetical protein TNCV_537171 [Trichonephila clavipes]